MIINLCGAGLSNSDIALALSRDVRTVNKWYQRWYNTGEVNVIKQRGRPRATTSEEDLNISLHAIQKPSITSNEIKTEAQIDCCRMTVGRRLRESKLFCRIARIKEHLSAGHKARRMLFAENNLNFAFWDRTIIVDESTFMTGHKTRTLVRRPIATAYEEKYIVQSAHSGRKSLPVFGLMHAEAIGPLVCIEGTFDSEKYIDILDDIVLPYIEEHFPDGHFYYYQDNSPIHRARTVREWFERNIPVHQLFETPPKSPDIPPIENLWGLAKVRVSSDGIYADEEELWLAICEAWNDMRELTNNSRN
jgi:hypothetical protein